MRNLCLIAILCAMAAFPAAGVLAASSAPPTYDLQRIQTKAPLAFAWTVHAAPGNARGAPAAPNGMHRALDAPALRAWVAHLPARSVIRFYSVAMPETHPDPNLRPDTTFWSQIKSFGQLCEERTVLFQPELHSF